MSKCLIAGVAAAFSSLLLSACGGSSPVQPPAPVPTATPTPAPTPLPKPLGAIPPCALAASNPGASADCQKPSQRLAAAVNAAIDRAITERTDLFNLDDVNGGPRILNYEAYMTAVVAALGEAGLCGKVDAEGEIGVKTSNAFNEQWIIASRAGWNPPTANYVQRKYVGACSPSTF